MTNEEFVKATKDLGLEIALLIGERFYNRRDLVINDCSKGRIICLELIDFIEEDALFKFFSQKRKVRLKYAKITLILASERKKIKLARIDLAYSLERIKAEVEVELIDRLKRHFLMLKDDVELAFKL